MSKIEWTNETWNPLTGCSPVSEGCRNCYAAREAAGRLSHHPAYAGLAEYRGAGAQRHPVFTGEIRLHPERLDQPLRWRRPRRVFVNSMSDLWHPDVSVGFIARTFSVMARCPQHTFQILTKRPERQARTLADPAFWRAVDDETDDVLPVVGPLPHVWLGTSVEDQDAAGARVEWLLRTPAAVRFLSMEPLLGPVDLGLAKLPHPADWSAYCEALEAGPLDWIIVGGESGPGARPFDVAWARDLRDQARAAGVAFFMKQLGACPVERRDGGTYQLDIRDRKGGDPDEWPADLRVREFPAEVAA